MYAYSDFFLPKRFYFSAIQFCDDNRVGKIGKELIEIVIGKLISLLITIIIHFFAFAVDTFDALALVLPRSSAPTMASTSLASILNSNGR